MSLSWTWVCAPLLSIFPKILTSIQGYKDKVQAAERFFYLSLSRYFNFIFMLPLFYIIANTVLFDPEISMKLKQPIKHIIKLKSVNPVSREEGGSTSPSTWCPSTDDPGESWRNPLFSWPFCAHWMTAPLWWPDLRKRSCHYPWRTGPALDANFEY